MSTKKRFKLIKILRIKIELINCSIEKLICKKNNNKFNISYRLMEKLKPRYKKLTNNLKILLNLHRDEKHRVIQGILEL